MTPSKKAAALAAGLAAALSLPAITPAPAAQNNAKADPATLVVDEATVDWIEKANVAALREGVVEKMELKIGDQAVKGRPIGYLHHEMAELSIKKAEVAAKSVGPKEKAKASRELAAAVVAINKRLNERIKGSVSYEEQAKAEAEFKVAVASTIEAEERVKLDQAELMLAERALEEHTIVAPFDGVVIERMKNPGESVRANESVVKIGDLSRLRAFAYVPLEFAYRVKEGQPVDLQVKLFGERHNPHPIEQKVFRGKISFVDPQIQPVAETAVRIYAEFENKDNDLKPGLKATLTIHLNGEGSASETAPAAVGARTNAPNGLGR